MGTWGFNVFDDDSAMDFFYELVENEDFISQIEDALNNATESEYLEVDEANAVLVSCSIIDACLNDTSYVFPSDDYKKLISAEYRTKFKSFKSLAVEAISNVLSENSEINELWDETDSYENWKNNILKIKENLM